MGYDIGSRIRAWDYEFDWTEEHLTPEQLRPLMFSYDVLATESVDRFDELVPSLPLRVQRTKSSRPAECPHSDFYGILKEHTSSDPTLQRLWDEVNTVPPWVDWAQIERGQKVFYRYAGPSIVSLTFHSLLGGMGSRRIVETLTRTGGFGVRVARRRLLETFQHVLDVTESLESIQPGGSGFASTLRVRFLHASVRRRILRLARRDPDYYNILELGIPISDLDSVGTALTFSAALIWIGFPRQGIFLRADEISDYVALWRYVAYLLGTPTSYLATPSLAKAVLESLLLAEIEPTRTSCILANNIITSLDGQPPGYASADFLRAEAYWLNGNELAGKLDVPRPPRFYTLLVAGQCLFFMAMCYARRSIPIWDEAGINRMKRYLRKAVLDQVDGEAATHEFRYIPRFGQVTGPHPEPDADGDRAHQITDDTKKLQKTAEPGSRIWLVLPKSSVERRNLFAVLVAACCAAWLCARTAWVAPRFASPSSSSS